MAWDIAGAIIEFGLDARDRHALVATTEHGVGTARRSGAAGILCDRIFWRFALGRRRSPLKAARQAQPTSPV